MRHGKILKDIDRNGYEGIGKPERLSGDLSAYWSRRIGAYGNREKPFQLLLTENQDAVWVMPDYVCTIEYMPNTRQALRQPVFKEYRQDICPDEVSIYK